MPQYEHTNGEITANLRAGSLSGICEGRTAENHKIYEREGFNATNIEFQNKAEYKIGAITYKVTAHYKEDTEPIQSKIQKLLKKEVENNDFNYGLSQKKAV